MLRAAWIHNAILRVVSTKYTALLSQFPIATVSKRQPCGSHSTPELEIVAMHTTLRAVTIPIMELGKPFISGMKASVVGGNESMLYAMKTSRSATMRHLGRTPRASVSWINEHTQVDYMILLFAVRTALRLIYLLQRSPMAHDGVMSSTSFVLLFTRC